MRAALSRNDVIEVISCSYPLFMAIIIFLDIA